MHPILIREGTVVTAQGVWEGDILCDEGKIVQLGRFLPLPQGGEVIEAKGKYVFPGFIDPHVHIYLPFMGTFAKDDYETGCIAALCGGTTTLIDFVLPARGEDVEKAFSVWKEKAEGIACCDYSFHLGVTWWSGEVEKALRRIVQEEGIQSFKVFLAYKDALEIHDDELYQALCLARELDVVVTAHCENADLVYQKQRELLEQGCQGPEFHYESRPPLVEAEGTRHFCNFLRLTGAKGYVVHLSCKEALEEGVRAKLRGAKVWLEVVLPHLLLDKSYAERPHFEGAKYVMSPPLREKKNQEVLWNALSQGLISTVGTDHAPFDMEQKRMGEGDFTKIPNGLPGIEDRVRLLFTYGVQKKRLSLSRFVEVASTKAAKIFGLYPKKGAIQPGSDADLVIYNPSFEETISSKKHHMKVDYNPYEGFLVQGRCDFVLLRGQIMVKEGEFIGPKGQGQFIRRR